MRLKYSAGRLNRLPALDFSTFSETIPLPLHIFKLSSILGAAPRSPCARPSRRPASGVRGLGRRPKTVASLKAWSLGARPQIAAPACRAIRAQHIGFLKYRSWPGGMASTGARRPPTRTRLGAAARSPIPGWVGGPENHSLALRRTPTMRIDRALTMYLFSRR